MLKTAENQGDVKPDYVYMTGFPINHAAEVLQLLVDVFRLDLSEGSVHRDGYIAFRVNSTRTKTVLNMINGNTIDFAALLDDASNQIPRFTVAFLYKKPQFVRLSRPKDQTQSLTQSTTQSSTQESREEPGYLLSVSVKRAMDCTSTEQDVMHTVKKVRLDTRTGKVDPLLLDFASASTPAAVNLLTAELPTELLVPERAEKLRHELQWTTLQDRVRRKKTNLMRAPLGPKREEDNIDMGEAKDDHSKPVKTSIPIWAQDRAWKAAYEKQRFMDPDLIFGVMVPKMELEKIFTPNHFDDNCINRVKAERHSAGRWTQDRLRKREVVEYAQKLGFIHAHNSNQHMGHAHHQSHTHSNNAYYVTPRPVAGSRLTPAKNAHYSFSHQMPPPNSKTFNQLVSDDEE